MIHSFMMGKKNAGIACIVVLAMIAAAAWLLREGSERKGAAQVPGVENQRPIPGEVIELIRNEKQITRKVIIDHEWKGDVIQITTGVISGPLDGHGFEFTAEKTSRGWELHNIAPWTS